MMKEIDYERPGASKNAVILRTLTLITNNIWIKSQDKSSVEEDSEPQNDQKDDSRIGYHKNSSSSIVKSTNQKNDDTESRSSVDCDEQVEEAVENYEETEIYDLPDIDDFQTLRSEEESCNRNIDIEKQSKNEGIYEITLKSIAKSSSCDKISKNKKDRYKLHKVRRTRLHKSKKCLSLSVIDERDVSRVLRLPNVSQSEKFNEVKKESIKLEPLFDESIENDLDTPKLYDRLKLLPRKSSKISKIASSAMSKNKRNCNITRLKHNFKLKSVLILVENGGVYSSLDSVSKKTDNFLDYLESGSVNVKEENGSLYCVLTEEQKRESLKRLRFLTMQEELGQFKHSSSRLNRKLQIDMCNSILPPKDDAEDEYKPKKSKMNHRCGKILKKVKSEPFEEFEWFCLDCEGCTQSDCLHYDHPRCLVNGDLNEHFDNTGHSWAQPISNFVKTENICLIQDLKYDPNHRDLIDNLLKSS